MNGWLLDYMKEKVEVMEMRRFDWDLGGKVMRCGIDSGVRRGKELSNIPLIGKRLSR